MGDQAFIRKPSEFKHDCDFSVWYAQFSNFAKAAKIEKANQFVALCSYLDNQSFAIVQSLEIKDTDQADPAKYKPVLEKALGLQDKIPPRLALKYRTQGQDESLSDFAMALCKLATKAGISEVSKEEVLVDSFCTGVLEQDLSVKLLESDFANLSLALSQAQKIESASQIRKFVRPSTSNTTELEILATNAIQHNTLNSNAQNFQPGRRQHPNTSNQGQQTQANSGNPHQNKRCYHCNKFGHIRRNCRKLAKERENARNAQNAQNFALRPGPQQ